MIIPCTAALNVTRAGDSVQVELPTGDKLEMSPEVAREAGYWLDHVASRIQLEKAKQRKNAREAGRE